MEFSRLYEAQRRMIDEDNTLQRKPNHQDPTIGRAWRRDWDQLTPFFEYPDDIRKVIYTTNAIESIHRSFRNIRIISSVLCVVPFMSISPLRLRNTHPQAGATYRRSREPLVQQVI